MDQFINPSQIQFYDIIRPKYTQEIFADILSKTKGNENYLDIACGTGQLLIPLSKNFKSSIGLDVSPAQIAKAKENVNKLADKKNIHLILSDIYDLSTQLIQAEILKQDDNSKIFDLITIGQAFHWFDEVKLLSYLKTILKDDGTLILAGYKKQHFIQEEQPELHQIYQNILDKLMPFFEMDVGNIENSYYKSIENIKNAFDCKKISTKYYKESLEITVDKLFDRLKSSSAYVNYGKLYDNDDVFKDFRVELMNHFKIQNEYELSEIRIKSYNFYFVVFID